MLILTHENVVFLGVEQNTCSRSIKATQVEVGVEALPREEHMDGCQSDLFDLTTLLLGYWLPHEVYCAYLARTKDLF